MMSCPHCRYPFTLPPKGMVTRLEPIPSAHFTRECSNCGALFRFEVVQVKGPTREEYPKQKPRPVVGQPHQNTRS